MQGRPPAVSADWSLSAIGAGKYADEIVPFKTTMMVTDKITKQSHAQEITLDRDEGPRHDACRPGCA